MYGLKNDVIPDWAAAAGGILIVAVLVFTTVFTMTREPLAPFTESAAVVDSRDITVARQSLAEFETKTLAVLDAEDGSTIAVLNEQEGGFIRSVLRALSRGRLQSTLDRDVPFRVTSYANGRIALIDLETGRVIDIKAFGPKQAEAFAALL
ncbi:MAG: photosynthetic complex assembly protein PuhC [Pseudomonadota bacterium]